MSKPPPRLLPHHIDEAVQAITVLLRDAAGISGDMQHKDLRIAQVLGNLGDCYYMEDREFIDHIWQACD